MDSPRPPPSANSTPVTPSPQRPHPLSLWELVALLIGVLTLAFAIGTLCRLEPSRRPGPRRRGSPPESPPVRADAEVSSIGQHRSNRARPARLGASAISCGAGLYTPRADVSGIMRGMTNPKTKPAALALILLAGLLASSCHKPEPPACPVAPFSGPFTCEVREVDKAIPCIQCLKESCCAEVQACQHEDATCGCLWLCAGNKKMPFDKCASRCPARTSTTYSSLSTCLDTHCTMCPQEQG